MVMPPGMRALLKLGPTQGCEARILDELKTTNKIFVVKRCEKRRNIK
jgi:hypothetical protein